MKFFDKIRTRVNEWMRGRNGADDLATTVVWISIILYIINIFTRFVWLWCIALVLLVYAWWRMTSRNIDARSHENYVFLMRTCGIRPWLRNPLAAWKEFRTYKHFKCPNCGQRVRIPRGSATLIRISCPKCHTKFEKKMSGRKGPKTKKKKDKKASKSEKM